MAHSPRPARLGRVGSPTRGPGQSGAVSPQHHGKHIDRPDEIIGNDPAIKGWPWIDGTHSWVGATGLTILALVAAGAGTQARVAEGRRMIADRQLPAGGWNYGNTTVFGQALRPMPETTGIALNALKEQASRETLQRSLDYLKVNLAGIRTPYSLAWGLMGLGAWGRGAGGRRVVAGRLSGTTGALWGLRHHVLALLLLARLAPRGLPVSLAHQASEPDFHKA